MKAKKITVLSLCTALAMIMSYIESLFPAFWVPGVKVGLPNIIIIFILYRIGTKEAIAVSFARIFLNTLLFGNPLTLAYSLAGGFLSILSMIILKKIKVFSQLGVSVVGGIMHNTGQIIVACIIMETAQISLYLPVLIITGILAGICVGLAGNLLIKRINKI